MSNYNEISSEYVDKRCQVKRFKGNFTKQYRGKIDLQTEKPADGDRSDEIHPFCEIKTFLVSSTEADLRLSPGQSQESAL